MPLKKGEDLWRGAIYYELDLRITESNSQTIPVEELESYPAYFLDPTKLL